jgi:hypothetical protein
MKRILIAASTFIFALHLEAQTKFNPTSLPDNGVHRINPQVRGVWKCIGGGCILDATADTFKLYNYTDFSCYLETDDYTTNLLNSSSLFTFSNDTLNIYLHDFGSKSDDLQSGKKFVRVSALPKNCSVLTESQQNDPAFLFDVFWHTLKENYAFAKERNLDWDELYRLYKPKISRQTSKEDLHKMMGEIVKLTKDHHTKIIYKDKTLQYNETPSAALLYENFSRQDTLKDFDKYVNLFFKSTYEGISTDLLKGKGEKVANGKLEWGHLTADIGYIHVFHLPVLLLRTYPGNSILIRSTPVWSQL